MKSVEFQNLSGLEMNNGQPVTISPDVFRDVPVQMEVLVGSTQLSVKDAEGLSVGQIITLQESLSEPIKLVLNGQVIALGELVAEGDHYGIKITQLG